MGEEMKFLDKGELELNECDDANIPVNSFINEPEFEGDTWKWTADNYMPRKGDIHEGSYEIHSRSKDQILKAVKKYVVPLYKSALSNLENNGCCYYWGVVKPT